MIKKAVDTGTSQAVPHLSTNPALRRLTSEFEWDPVFSPQYGRQQNQYIQCPQINISNYFQKHKKKWLSTLGLPKRSPTLVLTQPQGAQLRSSNGIRCFHLSMADSKINDFVCTFIFLTAFMIQYFFILYNYFQKINLKNNIKNKKAVDTGTSQAVPHLSTNPALRRLTSEFEWDPVFSPQYGRQQNIYRLICCRHWDFPSGPPPQYQPSLKALNFGVRMGSGVFTLVWPTTKLNVSNSYKYINIKTRPFTIILINIYYQI
ncbi:transmembrane protein, putative (macronuclear) [Tetrahymena thermophila SB210]|uniref:Transmembrane protein, putative n=1 Tax=Tetrahymena thermophila (strain SB210) TaxID=312017 RepID=Q23AA0_TETTS|nr:transmembrane protein, putative [Tetrahymena thermophila SB210]EAR93592.3 transmembrane protein, putative [Tetrahymena thermophila SB210]|eukprot:XP_001013837.3 transmembrane protein, putative [Tetrahymena thermophila SB210]